LKFDSRFLISGSRARREVTTADLGANERQEAAAGAASNQIETTDAADGATATATETESNAAREPWDAELHATRS
jgi:hypothetical protein